MRIKRNKKTMKQIIYDNTLLKIWMISWELYQTMMSHVFIMILSKSNLIHALGGVQIFYFTSCPNMLIVENISCLLFTKLFLFLQKQNCHNCLWYMHAQMAPSIRISCVYSFVGFLKWGLILLATIAESSQVMAWWWALNNSDC